jgi:hypothetical protein
MTRRLGTILEDVAADRPVVDFDLLASSMQSQARRTRRRAIVATTVAVALLTTVLVVVAAPLVAPLERSVAPTTSVATVSGYPVRIDAPPWGRLRTLEPGDAPGPAAGWLWLNPMTSSSTSTLVTVLVMPDGSLWRLPTEKDPQDYEAAISPDGTRIAWVARNYPQELLIQNLVTGTRLTYDLARQSFAAQSPLFFSPDDHWLLASGLMIDATRTNAYSRFSPRGYPAGWLPDSSAFVTVYPNRREALTAPAVAGVHTEGLYVIRTDPTDLATSQVIARERVMPRVGEISQHSFALTPDPRVLGSVWSVGAVGDSPRAKPFMYSLAGNRSAGWAAGPRALSCSLTSFAPPADQRSLAASPPGFRGLREGAPRPVVSVPDGSSGAVIAVALSPDGMSTHQLSIVSPRLDPLCLNLAQGALDAGPTSGAWPFGQSDAGWTWYWRELVAGAIALAAVAALVVGWWRRRRRAAAARRRAGHSAESPPETFA